MTVGSLILVYEKRISFNVLVELVTGKTLKQATKAGIDEWNIGEQKGVPKKMCFVRVPHGTGKFFDDNKSDDECDDESDDKMHIGVMIGEICIGKVDSLFDTTQYVLKYAKLIVKLEKRGFTKLAEFLKETPTILASPDDCGCCS